MVDVILKNLDALSEGEQLGIPWGWTSTNGGHAMFLMITKKSPGYLVELHNTGSGKKYQPCLEISGVKNWVNRVIYKVSEQQVLGFRSFLSHILETVIYGNLSRSESFPLPYFNPCF